MDRRALEKAVQNLALVLSKTRKAIDIPDYDLPQIDISDICESWELFTIVKQTRIMPLEKPTVVGIANAMLNLHHANILTVDKRGIPVCRLKNKYTLGSEMVIDISKFNKFYLEIQRQYGPKPLPKL